MTLTPEQGKINAGKIASIRAGVLTKDEQAAWNMLTDEWQPRSVFLAHAYGLDDLVMADVIDHKVVPYTGNQPGHSPWMTLYRKKQP